MYGVMLLAVDMKIPGPIRERLIVAYQRYWYVAHHRACRTCPCSPCPFHSGNESELTNIEPVIKLFRSTGYLHHATAKVAARPNIFVPGIPSRPPPP
jgi:WASH complex subunit strumpellin